jgi:hypothetical protein
VQAVDASPISGLAVASLARAACDRGALAPGLRRGAWAAAWS